MNIRDFMNLQTLQHIQDSFSDATGLAAIAVDAEGNYITKGSNFTDFCMKYTRGSEEGSRRCVKCDNECTGAYFCHAGLMDFASDILIDGERVGAIIGGQVLPQEPEYEKFEAIADELGIDKKAYISALKKVPVRPEKRIRAAAALLGDVVNQLVNLEYFKSLNQKKMKVFAEEEKIAIDAARLVKEKTKQLQNSAAKENILAINASIEAGRAGQAGAGFAVVAAQMRDHSQNSAHMYGQIEEQAQKIETSILKMSQSGL